jgi:hypothetical protein
MGRRTFDRPAVMLYGRVLARYEENPAIDRLRKIPEERTLLEVMLDARDMERLIERTVTQGYQWRFNKKIPIDYKIVTERTKNRAARMLKGAAITYHEPKIPKTSQCEFNLGEMSARQVLAAEPERAFVQHPDIVFDERILHGSKRFEPLEYPLCMTMEKSGRQYELTVHNPALEILRRACWGNAVHWGISAGNIEKSELKNPINIEAADLALQMQCDLVSFVRGL